MTDLWTEERAARGGGRRRRRRRRRRGGAFAVILSLLIVAAIVAGGAYLALGAGSRIKDALSGGSASDYAGPGAGSVSVQVKPGDTLAAIGRTLKGAGVVASVDAFMTAANAEPRATSIQPGFYSMRKKMKAADAVALLLDPKAKLLARVTLPEGLRLDETLKALSKGTKIPLAKFEAVLRTPATLKLPPYAKGQVEGFLFPATYEFGPTDTAQKMLAELVARFHQAETTVGLTASGRSPAQLVVIASIVEAEARRAEDYPKVARVIYNRLAKGMALQMDSTVNYALKSDKTIVTIDDLGVNSPYNTYKHPGLPPGPIGSPGERALRAAISPAAGNWLYFVTTNPSTGETKFTGDYNEFLKFKEELKSHQ